MRTEPPSPDGPLPVPGGGTSQWIRATWLILRGTTWRVALPVALVVGTLLAVINQGSELATGQADATTVLQIAANYVVPYIVSSVGYLSASPGQAAAREAQRR